MLLPQQFEVRVLRELHSFSRETGALFRVNCKIYFSV